MITGIQTKVERAAVALLDRKDEIALYCSRLEYVDGERYLYSRMPRLLSIDNAAVENIATGCTVGITHRVRSEVLAGRPYDFIMHDWWLYLYCSAFGCVIFDVKPSIKYRQHGGNTIGAATGLIDTSAAVDSACSARWRGSFNLRQLTAFLACYGGGLTEQNRRILSMLVVGKERFFTVALGYPTLQWLANRVWTPLSYGFFSDRKVLRHGSRGYRWYWIHRAATG